MNFRYSKIAFLPVKLKVALTTVVQHPSKPYLKLLHIVPPHNKIIHNYLNTFNVPKQMEHNILEDFWGRCYPEWHASRVTS